MRREVSRPVVAGWRMSPGPPAAAAPGIRLRARRAGPRGWRHQAWERPGGGDRRRSGARERAAPRSPVRQARRREADDLEFLGSQPVPGVVCRTQLGLSGRAKLRARAVDPRWRPETFEDRVRGIELHPDVRIARRRLSRSSYADRTRARSNCHRSIPGSASAEHSVVTTCAYCGVGCSFKAECAARKWCAWCRSRTARRITATPA